MKHKAGLTLLFLLCWLSLFPKAPFVDADFCLPMRIPPVLSANFGELRSDHFHSGLDFKTQGVIGKSIYSVADGHVSRISVRKYGYGKALYIDHPNGYTSVYAHLEYLSPRLDSVLRAAQYEEQSYEVNLYFDTDELPVKQGEWIAVSGNTGGSGGPHLHFEIRDTQSEDVMDPLLWYAPYIKDLVKPRIQALAVYQFAPEAHQSVPEAHPSAPGDCLSSRTKKSIVNIADNQLQGALPKVWGNIALGLKAYDYMSDTHNIYGVQLIRLFLDDKEIFRQDLSRFSFDNTRYINYITDYEEWALHRSWIMRSYFPHNGQGIVNISEEKDYHFRYELSDRHGNTQVFRFTLHGEKPMLKDDSLGYPQVDVSHNIQQKSIKRLLQKEFQNNLLYRDAMLRIPPGSLYENTEFTYSTSPCDGFSPIYHVGYAGTPLHQKIELALAVSNDQLSEKEQYYLAYRNHKNEWEYVASRYENGWMLASVNRLGDYRVLADTISPKISLTNIDNDLKNDLIRILVKDNESDIANFQVYIDGHWALFEDDYKRDAIFYRIDGVALRRERKQHRLKVKVWDHCGNYSEKETLFIY